MRALSRALTEAPRRCSALVTVIVIGQFGSLSSGHTEVGLFDHSAPYCALNPKFGHECPTSPTILGLVGHKF
jgi:hypothetical protein